MAEDRSSGSIALAVRDITPRQLTRYLSALKPILAGATDARANWVRFLGTLAQRPDLAEVFGEAQAQAIGQGRNLDDVRRLHQSIPVPAGFAEMHLTVDRWLKALSDSCEVVARSMPPLRMEILAQSRRLVQEAGVQADEFNRQRTELVEGLEYVGAASDDPNRPRFIANGKEVRGLVFGFVFAVILLLGVLFTLNAGTGGGVFGPNSLGANAFGLAPAKPTPAPKVDRRVYPQTEVLGRLRAEVLTRQLQFQDADVRLVAPDSIIVTGRVQGPRERIPVEAELQLQITPEGMPRLAAKRLSAVNAQVPPEAFEALNKRLEEANQTLPQQVPAGQRVGRLFIENNAIVAEMVIPPPAAPPPKPKG